MEYKARGEKSLIDSILNLTDLVSVYVRQEVKKVVDQSIAGPIGVAARKAALLIMAFTLFALASIFIAVGLFLLLAALVGFILAYLIIGAVLLLVGFLFLRQINAQERSAKKQSVKAPSGKKITRKD